MQQTGRSRRELTDAIREVRRAMAGDMLAGLRATPGGTELTMVQLATLFLLTDQRPRPVKDIAEHLGRSVSATSRLLDNMVRSRLIKRREDTEDRRVRLVAIAAGGEKLVGTLMDKRVDAQLALMELLTPEERATVARGMSLLAEAVRRRGDER